MLQLKNTTPFETEISLFQNENAVDTLYVTIKATFSLKDKPEIAESQLPVIMADEYFGEPGQSSIKYASELHLLKPSTDIIMLGEASLPDKQPVETLDVVLTVADIEKTVRVFGDRQWNSGFLGLTKSSPALFESMPLIYERAYGGIHEIDPENGQIFYEPRNPVGIGFKGKRKNKELKGTFLPNLEDPGNLISKPEHAPVPACFGYIAPSWEPRKSFVGTYDKAWQENRAPYLPKDFNPKFYKMAHPDLICEGYLKGGEPVKIVNMSPHGVLSFNLPVCEIELGVQIQGKTEKPVLNMETVLLEPNELRFAMIWRAGLECDKKALKINNIKINLKSLKFR